jgi:hypothetical protein
MSAFGSKSPKNSYGFYRSVKLWGLETLHVTFLETRLWARERKLRRRGAADGVYVAAVD